MYNSQTGLKNIHRPNPELSVGYSSDSIRSQKDDRVISGFFPKPNSVKAMAIKKVNNTLCGLLICAILISAVSYYFVVSSEIKLNKYSRETTKLNIENAELQNKLDKLKSFNNVDITMKKSNLLQQPVKVIEATGKVTPTEHKKDLANKTTKPKAWTIGY